jgi:putative proteasome-type protease
VVRFAVETLRQLQLRNYAPRDQHVNDLSTYSKMYTFQPAPDRLFVLLAARSPATTHAVISWIRRDLNRPADLEAGASKNLRHCDSLVEAAAYVGG